MASMNRPARTNARGRGGDVRLKSRSSLGRAGRAREGEFEDESFLRRERRGARREGRPESRPNGRGEAHLPRLHELLLEALETEIGGVQVYEAALECAVEPRLHEEWDKYLDETKRHVDVLREAFADLGLDPMKETPGRAIVRAKGRALVATMSVAAKAGDPVGAQIVAAECVVDAETKDHANWSLLAQVAKSVGDANVRGVLARAVERVEDEEDEHLYHTMGWARELWLDSLGLPAKLPPPEERRDVRSMAAAAAAKQSRDQG